MPFNCIAIYNPAALSIDLKQGTEWEDKQWACKPPTTESHQPKAGHKQKGTTSTLSSQHVTPLIANSLMTEMAQANGLKYNESGIILHVPPVWGLNQLPSVVNTNGDAVPKEVLCAGVFALRGPFRSTQGNVLKPIFFRQAVNTDQ